MDYGPKRCDAGDRDLRGSRITGFLTQALRGGEETESAPVPPLDGLGSYADSGFEPVSAETQPVSGRLPIQISDIESFIEQRLALEISAFGSPFGARTARPESCPAGLMAIAASQAEAHRNDGDHRESRRKRLRSPASAISPSPNATPLFRKREASAQTWSILASHITQRSSIVSIRKNT